MTSPVGYGKKEPLPSPGNQEDRATRAMRDFVRAALPQLALLGLWDYRVDSITANATEVVCSPVDPSLGLPGGVLVKITPSSLGGTIVATVGSRLVLAFLDGNAGKPIAICGDPDVSPVSAKLFGGTKGVARLDDAVRIGNITASGGSGSPVLLSFEGGTALPSIDIFGAIDECSLKLKVG